MDTPWQAYMHLGIVGFMIFPKTIRGEEEILESAQKIAQDPFFNVLEVTRVKDFNTLQQLRDLLNAAHMEVGFGAQPGLLLNKLNLCATDEAARKAAVADVQQSIDQAYFLGARITALLSGPNSYTEANKEAATQALIRSLKELCAYAKEKATNYTMAISLETFDTDIEKRALMGPSVEAARLAEAVKKEYDNFGLTIDLSHLPLLRESARHALTVTKDHLIHIHVGNCLMKDKTHPAYGDYHPRFGIPGGENDVDELVEFLRVLFEVGYFQRPLPTRKPVVTFEVKPLPGETPELVIANTKRVWQEAWARL